MSQEMMISQDRKNIVGEDNFRFFTETIEVGRIAPRAFLEAGQEKFAEEHFYWQNANQTLTLVGLGHAKVLTSEAQDDRFTDISKRWKQLCEGLIKEEKDEAPILFGGFSFDPKSTKNLEWNKFPSAYFVVPSFQLISKDGQTSISINLITLKENAVDEFEALRIERDRLIHVAQMNEFGVPDKPVLASLEEVNKEQYMDAVQEVTAQIQNGEAEKVVIARSVQLNFEEEVSSTAAMYHISNEQQESYHFGLQNGRQLFFGATPERLIEIADGRAYSACVAGSSKRGKTVEADQALGEALLADNKNREEHQYVVHMISKVFEAFGTDIKMPNGPKLMKIRDIQHLFTPIEANVEEHIDIFRFVEALHPTPALGGLPTNKSMEIIRDEERMDRGYYAAPIGWTDTAGNGEFAVAIRSALLDKKRAHLYAGGGIVADSEVEKEYEETWVKFRPVLRALGGKLDEQ